jgi:hypothetical protein
MVMAKSDLTDAKFTQQSQVDVMHRTSQHLHSCHSVDQDAVDLFGDTI